MQVEHEVSSNRFHLNLFSIGVEITQCRQDFITLDTYWQQTILNTYLHFVTNWIIACY